MSILKKILRTNRFTSQILEGYFFSQNFLKSKGWYESRFLRQSIDADQQAIPWFTYASINFIAQKLDASFSVFEFGSGNSTKWFAKRVKHIVSVEHDASYYKYVHDSLVALPNVVHEFRELESTYTTRILEYENAFDIIIIDGRERVQCAKNSLKALKANGVIIWDNSDRNKYQEGCQYLKEQGFKQLDFRGAAPISHGELQTSIFYRDNNCFDI